MTRMYVYASALVVFVASTAMTLASIATTDWITYSVTTAKGDTFEKKIGLHRSCSTLDTPNCRPFPRPELCQEGQRYFCSMWRTIGFMAALASILSFASLICFLIVMYGGKLKRETGWPFVSGMLAIVTAVELTVISMVAFLFDHDEQFVVPGWKLSSSWYLATVSAVLSFSAAVGMGLSAYLLPPEGGYEFLDDPAES